MKRLTWNDTQNLLHGIQQLYSLHDLDSFGVNALTIVDQLIPSEFPVFNLNSLQSQQISYLFLPGYSGLTPEMQEIPRRYWKEHPIVQNMPDTLTGAYKISDFINQKELHQLEGLYQQLMSLMGWEDQMVVHLISNQLESSQMPSPANPEIVAIALNRSKRNFTERDRLILNLLRPHLFQAYSNAKRYQQLQQNLAQLSQSLDRTGVIFLDGVGQAKLMTPQAATWLQSYFPNHNGFSQLPEQLHSWVRHQIAQLNTEHDLPSPCLPLHLQQGDRKLTIRLVVDRPGEQYLLLLAQEQVLSLLTSLKLIGLSKREAEVLSWIIKGKDNQVIALEMKIRHSTVRKHLENIYSKLNVQSRTEAVTVALEKLGCLHSAPLI